MSIRNPETGRMIKINGPTYKNLMFTRDFSPRLVKSEHQGVAYGHQNIRNSRLDKSGTSGHKSILSPKTGRLIKVNGPAYKNLMFEGLI